MSKQPPSQPSPSSELMILVREGRLFDLQRWIGERKPLRFGESNRSVVLRAAIETGFHSMVETMLKAATWSPEELGDALRICLYPRRPALAELVINAGASFQAVDFGDVCMTMNASLMKRFLHEGGDPAKDNAFARALSDYKAKPLLGFYREMRGEYPVLNSQAALALYQAVDERNLRWTSLLVWAGADPLLPVPYGLDDKWGETESMTTAADQACWLADDRFFKAMRLKPTKEQALEFCRSVAFKPTVAKFEMLLRGFSAEDLNQGERRSCRFLEDLVGDREMRFSWSPPDSEEDTHRIQCIEFLLDRGARWNPSDEGIREARRGLATHKGLYVVQVIRLLLYTAGASDVHVVWEVCRTEKLKSLILLADSELWEELKTLRKN